MGWSYYYKTRGSWALQIWMYQLLGQLKSWWSWLKIHEKNEKVRKINHDFRVHLSLPRVKTLHSQNNEFFLSQKKIFDLAENWPRSISEEINFVNFGAFMTFSEKVKKNDMRAPFSWESGRFVTKYGHESCLPFIEWTFLTKYGHESNDILVKTWNIRKSY